MEITDTQLKNSFKNTNFGEIINTSVGEMRKCVVQAVMKRACGWSTGHTMRIILIELRLISGKTFKPSRAALKWMYSEVYRRTERWNSRASCHTGENKCHVLIQDANGTTQI